MGLKSNIILGGLFVVVWSSGFVGAKYGLAFAGPFTILFWRYLLVVLLLAVLVSVWRKWQAIPPRELIRHLIVGGMAHAVWLSAVLGAINLGLSAGLTAFITALQPILTGALSARMTGEAVSPREWGGLVIGLLAVGIVIGDGIALGGAPIAYVLPFITVIAISIASLIDRKATNQGDNQASIMLVAFWHSVASLIILTPMAFGFEGFQATWNGELIFAIIWLAVIVSMAAYGLMFLLLRRIAAAKVASLIYLSPPVTMMMAWLLFAETVTNAGIIGLIIAAIAVSLTMKR